MAIDHHQQHLQTFRAAISTLLYPLQQLIDVPRSSQQWLSEGVMTRKQLQEDNTRLKEQELLLRVQLQKLDTLQIENIRLRQLLDSAQRIGERVLIAEIMSVDLNPFSRQIVLSKGSYHGVYTGQPILDAGGVMGQIIKASPFSSIAMIISDPGHAVPVTVNRNGLRAIAIGTGTSAELNLPHLPNNADIMQGDLLVTSGLGGRFPPGYPVAKITNVMPQPSAPFAKVTALAIAKLDHNQEVLLVWRNDPDSVQTTEKENQADPCTTDAQTEDICEPINHENMNNNAQTTSEPSP